VAAAISSDRLLSKHDLVPRSISVNDKSSWRIGVLEGGLIIAVLAGIGIIAAAMKLGPILMRWAKTA
jgi:hypothetical protein